MIKFKCPVCKKEFIGFDSFYSHFTGSLKRKNQNDHTFYYRINKKTLDAIFTGHLEDVPLEYPDFDPNKYTASAINLLKKIISNILPNFKYTDSILFAFQYYKTYDTKKLHQILINASIPEGIASIIIEIYEKELYTPAYD